MGAVSARKRGVWPWAAGEVGSGEVGVLQEQRSGRASGEERGSCVSNIFNHLFLIEVLLTCNIVLVSIVQHVMQLYMYTHMGVGSVC